MTDRYQADTFPEFLGATYHRSNGADGEWGRLLYLTQLTINEQVESLERRSQLITPRVIIMRDDLITMARAAVLSYLYPKKKSETKFDDCVVLFILMCLEEKKFIDVDILMMVAEDVLTTPTTYFDPPRISDPMLEFLNEKLHPLDVVNHRVAMVPFEDMIAGVNDLKGRAMQIIERTSPKVYTDQMENLKPLQENYAEYATTKTCDEDATFAEVAEVVNCRDMICWFAWYYKAVIDYGDSLTSDYGISV